MKNIEIRPAILILTAIVCLAVGYLLYVFDVFASSSSSMLGFKSISNVEEVSISGSKESVELYKKGNHWFTADGHLAEQDMAVELLYRLQLLEPVRQLSEKEQKQFEEQQDSCLNITVSRGWGLEKTCCICHTSKGIVGHEKGKMNYYLLMEEHINTQINFFAYLSPDIKHWHQRRIFGVLPSDIREVDVTDYAHPEQAYKMVVDTAGSISLTNIYQELTAKNVDEELVKRYLSYFYGTGFKDYANLNETTVDSLIHSTPAYSIGLKGKNGKKLHLKLFNMAPMRNPDVFGRRVSSDRNYLYLQMDDSKDIMVARWVDYDVLLRSFEYFINK
jgi:hypothetical protein